ncbi:hypothetical protein SAMN05428949_5917 [Chitinophaga sp. YR627]|nr:hypothetical protein SAMN05428949_5917 [Chitinophaga sp. YR627]
MLFSLKDFSYLLYKWKRCCIVTKMRHQAPIIIPLGANQHRPDVKHNRPKKTLIRRYFMSSGIDASYMRRVCVVSRLYFGIIGGIQDKPNSRRSVAPLRTRSRSSPRHVHIKSTSTTATNLTQLTVRECISHKQCLNHPYL